MTPRMIFSITLALTVGGFIGFEVLELFQHVADTIAQLEAR